MYIFIVGDSAVIGIIVGSTIGGLFIFIGCPAVIITIVVCVVYHSTRSGRTVITTHPTTTTTDGGAPATTQSVGGATNQPGFQLQKLGKFS